MVMTKQLVSEEGGNSQEQKGKKRKRKHRQILTNSYCLGHGVVNLSPKHDMANLSQSSGNLLGIENGQGRH